MLRPDHAALALLSTPCLVVDATVLRRDIETMGARRPIAPAAAKWPILGRHGSAIGNEAPL